MNRRVFAATGLLLAALLARQGPALAQTKEASDSCRFYQGAVQTGATIPDKLLTGDWRTALRCLVSVLENLKERVAARPTPDDWAQFVRTTGAVRIIIANNEAVGSNVNPAVQFVRTIGTLDALSTLAFGARTEDDNSRLNATLVLGNVIDNQGVCVPIDHLYYKDLDATAYGVKGRANLLAVVSVVAPWAYKENYQKIEALYKDMRQQLEPLRARPDLKDTFSILDNLRKRLDFQQKPGSNKDVSIPKDLRACQSYRPQWAGDKLKYTFP
jgi:hypothetical protein